MKPIYLIDYRDYKFEAYIWSDILCADYLVTGKFAVSWDDDIPCIHLDPKVYLGDHASEVEICLVGDTEIIIVEAIEGCYGDPRWYEDRNADIIDSMEKYMDR